MPTADSVKVNMRLRGAAGSEWTAEEWVFGFHLRYDLGVSPQWPQQGPLPKFQQDIKPAIESDGNWLINWAHYVDDAPGTFRGFTQADYKVVRDACATFLQDINLYIPSFAEWAGIDMWATSSGEAGQPAAGKSVGGINRFVPMAPPKGSATTGLPPNDAVVVSHQSGLPGRRYKGRSYFGPVGPVTMISGGIIQTANRDKILQEWAAMFQTLKNTQRLIPTCIHRPDRTYGDVITVAVGDEIDIQNRRRNQRSEEYGKLSIT